MANNRKAVNDALEKMQALKVAKEEKKQAQEEADKQKRMQSMNSLFSVMQSPIEIDIKEPTQEEPNLTEDTKTEEPMDNTSVTTEPQSDSLGSEDIKPVSTEEVLAILTEGDADDSKYAVEDRLHAEMPPEAPKIENKPLEDNERGSIDLREIFPDTGNVVLQETTELVPVVRDEPIIELSRGSHTTYNISTEAEQFVRRTASRQKTSMFNFLNELFLNVEKEFISADISHYYNQYLKRRKYWDREAQLNAILIPETRQFIEDTSAEIGIKRNAFVNLVLDFAMEKAGQGYINKKI